MAWSFRRRVKIIPGVHLNFSRSGISTSIGVKGASMTFGKSGTYLNTGIPALGIYNRQKLSNPIVNPLPTPSIPIEDHINSESKGNIFSADIEEITSQDMQGIKEAILLARQQRISLKNDLGEIHRALRKTKTKKIFSNILLYGLLNKDIGKRLQEDMHAQNDAIQQTQEQIDACYVQLDADFEDALLEKYNTLVIAFSNLCTSHRIWDVTSTHYQDRAITRSSASTVVSRRTVRFGKRSLPEFKSELQGLYLQNANGADLYIYPSFVVMQTNDADFAIIGIDELDLQYGAVRFVEDETVPPDTRTIDRTWAKVNKNGSPDRRFRDNYQIPIVRYGEISLKTATGLHEEYKFSNYEFTDAFGKAFSDYQEAVYQIAHTI